MECHGSVGECQDRAQLLEEQVDEHLKTLESSVDLVKSELQNRQSSCRLRDDDRLSTWTMSGKAQAGIGLIPTVRARLAIALRRRVPSCRSELKFYATAPSSLDGHLVEQRESDLVTERKGEFFC